MPDFADRPPTERIKRYLDLADDAFREAAQSEGPARESYLLMAEHWKRRAAEAAESHSQMRAADASADHELENIMRYRQRAKELRAMANRAVLNCCSKPQPITSI